MTTSANKNILLLLTCLLCLTSCGANKPSVYVIGCSNNAAGMLMNYAVTQSGAENLSAYRTDRFSSYLLMDCCSSKTVWSLTSGELDAAVLCPDAAENFLAENKGYRVAGALTYGTEVLVYQEGTESFDRIGYMSGQARQKQALERVYPQSEYTPVLMTSLAYALHMGEVDAAVLDITTAVILSDPYIQLADDAPTAVLVVSDAFFESAEYSALLLAWENAKAAIGEYEPFCEAMTFLFSEKPGGKEYEKWLSIEEKLFQAPEKPGTP